MVLMKKTSKIPLYYARASSSATVDALISDEHLRWILDEDCAEGGSQGQTEINT